MDQDHLLTSSCHDQYVTSTVTHQEVVDPLTDLLRDGLTQ